MITVKLHKGQDVNFGLKRLRKQIQKEEIFQRLFERKFYKSEGTIRRERMKRAKYINYLRSLEDN